MSSQAHLTSLEALESFRSAVIVFTNKAHSAVDQVSDEIRRTRSWIQQEQRRRWEGEVQRRSRALAQAEQELLSAKLVGILDNLSVQQAAVRKARHAVQEAETKLRNVKRWTRDFDNATEALAKSLDSFRSMLAHDLPKGISFLTQAQITLSDYSGLHAAPAPPRSETPPAEEDPPPPET